MMFIHVCICTHRACTASTHSGHSIAFAIATSSASLHETKRMTPVFEFFFASVPSLSWQISSFFKHEKKTAPKTVSRFFLSR